MQADSTCTLFDTCIALMRGQASAYGHPQRAALSPMLADSSSQITVVLPDDSPTVHGTQAPYLAGVQPSPVPCALLRGICLGPRAQG